MERSNSLAAEEVAVANIRHRRIRIPRGKLNEATFGKLIYAILISCARISMVHESQVSFRCSDAQILRERRLRHTRNQLLLRPAPAVNDPRSSRC